MIPDQRRPIIIIVYCVLDIYYSLYNRRIHIVLVDINDIDSIKICLGGITTRVKL